MEPKMDTNAAVTMPAPPPEPAAVTNEVSSASPEPQRSDEVVSPQMFLKYFSKGTNGHNSTTVVAPLDFNPPKTGDVPRSSATYSTGQ
jgi:hypothetical protein